MVPKPSVNRVPMERLAIEKCLNMNLYYDKGKTPSVKIHFTLIMEFVVEVCDFAEKLFTFLTHQFHRCKSWALRRLSRSDVVNVRIPTRFSVPFESADASRSAIE